MNTVDSIMYLANALSDARVAEAQEAGRWDASKSALRECQKEIDDASAALLTALQDLTKGELKAGEQEPVAIVGVSMFTWLTDRPPAGTKLYAAPQPAQPEQGERDTIAMQLRQYGGDGGSVYHRHLLRAADLLQSAQPVAQPLTDEQIRQWWDSENGMEDCDMCVIGDFTQVVRAVENKLGVGAKE